MKKILCIILATIVLFVAGCSASTPAPAATEAPAAPAATEAPAAPVATKAPAAPVATEAPAKKVFTSTVKIIVPFNPGGSTDMLARLLAPELSTRFGVPVVVENKPGGGGAIGMLDMLGSKPDGHTVILTSVNAAALTPNMSDVGYTNKEMAPISQLTSVSTGVIVNAESDIKTLDELIAKGEANPGTMTFATTGTGSIHHIAAELMMKEIGKPGLFNHVPFNSGTEAIAAVLGKQIDFSFGDAADCLALVKDGKLRVLAMAADPGRDYFFPDAPSFKELGYNIGQMGPWTALAAPVETPDETINLWDKTVNEVMQLPNIQEGLVKLSLAPAYLNRADITAKWMAQYDLNKTIIDGLGIKQ
jgi:tripartite-type tricarboxylate transporter receptor subunit TctC